MSKPRNTSASLPFEMFVTISREDAPRLYDDLAGLPKGRRRINRFRFLANQGLMAEMLSTFLAGSEIRHEPIAASHGTPSNVAAFMRSMNLSLDEEGGGDE